MKTFTRTLILIVKEVRPRQWIKNLSLFTAILFSGDLFETDKVLKVFYAFIIFCALSSFTYIINDIHDKKEDEKHPYKKNRPIASGDLSISLSIIIALIILFFSLGWASLLSEYFFTLSIGYILLTLSYSFLFKNIAIIESMLVAMGFVLRVMAGSLIINTPISSWLTICTISLALLISFGRRKAEITLMGFVRASKHRPVLKKYPKKFLELMISSLVATTFLSYSMFTFTYENTSGLTNLMRGLLPDTLREPKWMMLTIPIAFYATARYLYLIYNKREKGQPEKLITTDLPFFSSVIIWGLITLIIIYIPTDFLNI